MTLIIGFVCTEGVALVSDSKVLDLETGESDWAHKILTPITNMPFIVGAAGFSDLFRQFSREIPEVVTKRVNEYRIYNIRALIESGLTRNQAIEHLTKIETPQVEKSTQQSISLNERKKTSKPKKEVAVIPLPYTYTYQSFIQDCKDTIGKITEQARTMVANPLDVLIGLKGAYPFPSLHYVNCLGQERIIDKYYAIGHGAPHVKQFFEHLYDPQKSMLELISYAFYAIAYAKFVAEDNTVGYDEQHPPEVVIVENNGNYGRIRFDRETEYLLNLEQEMELIKKSIKNTKFPILAVTPK